MIMMMTSKLLLTIMEMLILDMLYILILDPSKNIAVLLKQLNKMKCALRNVNSILISILCCLTITEIRLKTDQFQLFSANCTV